MIDPLRATYAQRGKHIVAQGPAASQPDLWVTSCTCGHFSGSYPDQDEAAAAGLAHLETVQPRQDPDAERFRADIGRAVLRAGDASGLNVARHYARALARLRHEERALRFLLTFAPGPDGTTHLAALSNLLTQLARELGTLADEARDALDLTGQDLTPPSADPAATNKTDGGEGPPAGSVERE